MESVGVGNSASMSSARLPSTCFDCSRPNYAVQVVSSTWTRDSHDLFDFEAHHLNTKTFNVPKSMKCIRNGTDVQMLSEHAAPPLGADQLVRLVQKDGSFWVDKASPSSSSKKLWLVVRDLATVGHRLSEADIIKLGRFKFRVHQMVSSGDVNAHPELKLDESLGRSCVVDPTKMAALATTLCRICLLEGCTEDDPLIPPCQCKGSIEYVHLGCLRHWIRGRLNLSDNPSGSYFYRPLLCELCKTAYPSYIHFGHDRMPLVEVPKTTPPFIVLENMVRDSQQHASRGLHVISLAENKLLKLGRGHESDVRIADVSISRCHATIRFHRGQFVLEDHNSKFGTLVAMKKPRVLDPGNHISIQVGRTVLSLTVQKLPDAQGGGPEPVRASTTHFGDPPPLFNGEDLGSASCDTSSAQDERALRLSLLTRGSRDDLRDLRDDSLVGEGGGGGSAGVGSIRRSTPSLHAEPHGESL